MTCIFPYVVDPNPNPKTETDNSLYVDQQTTQSLQSLLPYHFIKHMPVIPLSH